MRIYRRSLTCALLLLGIVQRAGAQDSLRILVQHLDPFSGRMIVAAPTTSAARVTEWMKQMAELRDSTSVPAFVASWRTDGLVAAGLGGADMVSFAPSLLADYTSLRPRRTITVDAKVDPQQAIQWLTAAGATDEVATLAELVSANSAQGLIGVAVAPSTAGGVVTIIRYGTIARSPQVKDNGGVTFTLSKMQPGDLEKALAEHRMIKDPAELIAFALRYLDRGYMTSQVRWMQPRLGPVPVTVWANRK